MNFNRKFQIIKFIEENTAGGYSISDPNGSYNFNTDSSKASVGSSVYCRELHF